MVNILLVSHYNLAHCIKETAFLIVGERKNVHSISIEKDEGIEIFTEKIKKKVEELKGEILIMTDMFGGTPSNVSLMLFGNNSNVQIIAGFNLPLVIESIMHSDMNVKDLKDMLIQKKNKTIINAKEIFKGKGK